MSAVHYGGEHRGAVLKGLWSPCGKPLFAQRSDDPYYDFDEAPNTPDRSAVTCQECLDALARDDARHWCAITGKSAGAHGWAATECFEDDDGRFVVTNDEYANTVRFCPECGAEAKVAPS